MALLYLDSFDHYVAADVTQKWTAASGGPTMVNGAGACGTRVMGFSGFQSVTKTVTPTGNTKRGIVGFRMKILSDGPNLFALIQTGEIYHFSVVHNGGTGGLDVRRGSLGGPDNGAGNVIAQSTAGVISTATWYYVEIRWFVHPTLGEIEIRLNGSTTILNATNLNTRGLATFATADDWTAFRMDARGGSSWYLDDLYLLDDQVTAADSINTGFNGDCAVDCLYPMAPGASATWTPIGAAANWDCVDDTADQIVAQQDGDTTRVESNTVGQTDTHALTNPTASVGAVFGAQFCTLAKKSDAGTRTIAPVIRTSATNYPLTTFAPSQGSYSLDRQLQITNPHTGVPFTIAEIAALEVGYTVIS